MAPREEGDGSVMRNGWESARRIIDNVSWAGGGEGYICVALRCAPYPISRVE